MTAHPSRSSLRRPVASSLFLFFSLLLSACTVDQEKEVQIYREVLDLPAQEQVLYTPGEPINVRQAMLLANRYNENLSIEGETYLQSLIERRRAVAQFWPTVSFGPQYVFREKAGGANGGSSDNTTFDAGVTGSINLFNGFRDAARLDRDTYTAEQRRLLLLDLQEQILLDVAQVFYQVLRSERQVEVLENSLRVQDERVRDMRGRQEAGVARPLDVAQTQAQASATRVSLIAARNDVVNGRSLLSLLTAVPLHDAKLLEAFDLPEIPAPMPEFLQLAMANRRDLAAADAQVLAARKNVDVAFGQYYPSVSLDLTGYLHRESSPSERDWEGILRANLPIFTAGLIEADVREAWSQFRQALLFRQYLFRQIDRDIRTAYENVVNSDERIRELRVQLTAAEQALRQAEESYGAGLATNLERITAQDQVLSAQLQLASEEFNRKLFYLNLLRAAGGLRNELDRAATTQPVTDGNVEVEPENQTPGQDAPATASP